MSKFKSVTEITVKVSALKAFALKQVATCAFAMGALVFVSGVCTAQYCSTCNTCSGGVCSTQLETPLYSGSTASPVAYESSLSSGYSQSYTSSYSSPVYSANTYSGSHVMANSFDNGTVLNSTYASPSYEQINSSILPTTKVSNISSVSTSYASPAVSDIAMPTYESYSNPTYVNSTYTSSIPISTSMPIASVPVSNSMPTVTYASASNMNSTYDSSYIPTAASTTYPQVSGTYASYSPNSVSNSGINPQTSTLASSYASNSGLAQQKAYQAANSGMMGHVGGGLGGCRYEGVGWSTVSPDHAISKCCYWGQRPVSQIGVARGQNGMWFACVLYQ